MLIFCKFDFVWKNKHYKVAFILIVVWISENLQRLMNKSLKSVRTSHQSPNPLKDDCILLYELNQTPSTENCSCLKCYHGLREWHQSRPGCPQRRIMRLMCRPYRLEWSIHEPFQVWIPISGISVENYIHKIYLPLPKNAFTLFEKLLWISGGQMTERAVVRGGGGGGVVFLVCKTGGETYRKASVRLPIKYAGSSIRVGSPGNFDRITITETELKHPRQSTEAEFCHLFSQA